MVRAHVSPTRAGALVRPSPPLIESSGQSICVSGHQISWSLWNLAHPQMPYALPLATSTPLQPRTKSSPLLEWSKLTCALPMMPTVMMTSPYLDGSMCRVILLLAPIAVSWP